MGAWIWRVGGKKNWKGNRCRVSLFLSVKACIRICRVGLRRIGKNYLFFFEFLRKKLIFLELILKLSKKSKKKKKDRLIHIGSITQFLNRIFSERKIPENGILRIFSI